MSDLISRQAAIDAITDESIVANMDSVYDSELRRYKRAMQRILASLPSAQPERKKGKWYKPTGMMPPEFAGTYRCSECDELAMRDWKTHKQNLTNFCPNCGADLRGEANA